MKALLVALLCTGCFYEDLTLDFSAAPVDDAAALVPEERAPGCWMSFAPGPGLEDEVADAAARWSAATGCAFWSSPDGEVPVTLVDELMGTYVQPDGTVVEYPICGATNVSFLKAEENRVVGITTEIVADQTGLCDWGPRGRVVLHEMGHSIMSQHTYSGSLHTKKAYHVMYSGDPGDYANKDLLGPADVALACSFMECSVQLPEAAE